MIAEVEVDAERDYLDASELLKWGASVKSPGRRLEQEFT